MTLYGRFSKPLNTKPKLCLLLYFFDRFALYVKQQLAINHACTQSFNDFSSEFSSIDDHNTSIFRFFLLTSSLSFASSRPPDIKQHNPSSLVDRVCKPENELGHLNYNDCVAALVLDLKALSAKNKKLLAKIELNLAISNSTSSLTYIDAMAKKEKSSPALKSALEYCISQYQYTVQCFKMALMDLDVDPETANYDAFVANDGQYYCGEQLNSKGFQSQVVDSINTRNYYVMLYSRIGQIITNKMT